MLKEMLEEYARRYRLFEKIKSLKGELDSKPVHEVQSDSFDLFAAKQRVVECETNIERLYLGVKEDILWEIMDMNNQKQRKLFSFTFNSTPELINVAFMFFEEKVDIIDNCQELFAQCIKQALDIRK